MIEIAVRIMLTSFVVGLASWIVVIDACDKDNLLLEKIAAVFSVAALASALISLFVIIWTI